jgi:hypothetical protein
VLRTVKHFILRKVIIPAHVHNLKGKLRLKFYFIFVLCFAVLMRNRDGLSQRSYILNDLQAYCRLIF